MAVGLAILGLEHSHTSGKLKVIQADPRVKLLGVYEADPSVAAARKAQEAFKGVNWFSSQQELLGAPGLQGVVVDGFARHNGAMARAALEAGKSVLLEKPAGVVRGDFEALQSLARAKGLYIQIGYQFRFMAAFEWTRRVVSQGLLGDLFFFRARISKDKSVYFQLLPELSRYVGGTFFELGCHILDMGIALMGKPQHVQRVLRTDFGPDPRFADNTVAVVEFPKGIGVFETSSMEPSPRRRVEIYGTKGSIIMNAIMPTELELHLEEAQAPYAKGWQTVNVGDRPIFVKDIEEFAAVINGKAPEYSAEHDLITQTALLDICVPLS